MRGRRKEAALAESEQRHQTLATQSVQAKAANLALAQVTARTPKAAFRRAVPAVYLRFHCGYGVSARFHPPAGTRPAAPNRPKTAAKNIAPNPTKPYPPSGTDPPSPEC